MRLSELILNLRSLEQEYGGHIKVWINGEHQIKKYLATIESEDYQVKYDSKEDVISIDLGLIK